MIIRSLQINYLNNLTGIRPDNLRLTWKPDECRSQESYRVTAAIDGVTAEDSGVVKSGDTFYMLKGSLGYKKKAVITVFLTSDEGETAEASVTVITGKDKNDFTAKWINPELKPLKKNEEQRGAYLKKEFEINDFSQDKEYYLYAACHGIMNIYINGSKVSDTCLMPGTQEYDKRLIAETIPVTGFLKKGRNEIIVMLGNGWYRGGIGNDHNKNVYGKDIAFLCELEENARRILLTDESWLASNDGPLGKNDLMDGEVYDATRIDTMTYHGVKTEKFGYDNLICRDCEPVKRHEEYKAVKYDAPNGDIIYDFGVNIAGVVEMTVNASEGDRVITEYGEVLDKDGNFTQSNFAGRVINHQRTEYVCVKGKNVYCPYNTYFGFRYIRVTGDVKTTADNFKAYALYSDIREASQFKCGVEEVNKLFANSVVSMKGNFVDVPTDCPTREKSGFSGDAQAFVKTACTLMDAGSVYIKWMNENRAGQFKDGCLPQISPKIVNPDKKNRMGGILELDGGIGWSDALEIIADTLYGVYSDRRIIEDNYEAIKRWVDFEIKKGKGTRLSNLKILPKKYRRYMIDKGFLWGEWLEPGQDDVNYMKNLVFHGDPEVGTAFLHLNCSILSKIAGILGRKEDEEKYGAYGEKVKEAYRAVYTDNGRVTESKRQCRFVRPVAHDLLTEKEKFAAAEQLAHLITENGNHLNTGFLTTHDLLNVLSNYGQTEKAYDLLLQPTYPSWLHAVNKGCTAIPENWDCYRGGQPYGSFSHYSYGAVSGWLMDTVLGIRVKDNKIQISPKPDKRLKFAEGSFDSPCGLIYSSWKYDAGRVHYEIEVPPGGDAEIIISGKTLKAGPGKHTYESN